MPQSLRLRRIVLALFVLVPLAFGAYALLLGQDGNWDLRNYHWYDAYAAPNRSPGRGHGCCLDPDLLQPHTRHSLLPRRQGVAGASVQLPGGCAAGLQFHPALSHRHANLALGRRAPACAGLRVHCRGRRRRRQQLGSCRRDLLRQRHQPVCPRGDTGRARERHAH